MNNFEQGFIKRAAEVGLLPQHAEELLKEAGFMNWLGNSFTNLKDLGGLAVNKLSNNRIYHGLNAAAGVFNGGTFDSRYNDSVAEANGNIAKSNADMSIHLAQQGNLDAARQRAERAFQYGGWTNSPDQINDVGERLSQFNQLSDEAVHNQTLAQDRMNSLRAQFNTMKPGYTPPPPPTYSGMTTQHNWGIQPTLKKGPISTPALLKAPPGQSFGTNPASNPTSFAGGAPAHSSVDLLRKPYGN